jgi:anti-sigma factor RsiW
MTSLHEHLAHTVQSDAALDAALGTLHREVLAEPVPPVLLDAARRVEALGQSGHQRQWLALAAAVLMAFGLGWTSHGTLANLTPWSARTESRVAHEFVRQAGFAHAVYLPEKRHPVEVLATEQEHLVQWLSKRLGRPLKIPNLEPQGFALVGGRLLPGEAGARAQFMFQNPLGQRITLYLGALDPAASTAAQQATQFRFEPDASVPSFYWAEQGFGYALSGQVDRATLMALANSVYSQIH